MHFKAKDTLTAVELDKGEQCTFTLRNGTKRTLVLEDTDARVLFTNCSELLEIRAGTATLYHISCTVTIDGHRMLMERYVGSQESYYEPYVVNGLRIWFDTVSAVFDKGLINERHGPCKPRKHARFALCDMTDDICPFELTDLYDNPADILDAEQSYNGDDMWMGAYNGVEAHGGMDVNMPASTPNYAPFPIDDHHLFSSLTAGGNNNRWRGTHTWKNGDVWTLQNHHVFALRVPEHEPIAAGTHYVDAAGVYSGAHDHAHYVFRVKQAHDQEEIRLDPWILFWQVFENNRTRRGDIRAAIAPLQPGKTGVAMKFSSEGSVAGRHGGALSYYWTFGDGGWSDEETPTHTYTRPGIYPVTLVVDNQVRKATRTQHVTIDGDPVAKPVLTLVADDEPSFRIRPVHMMNTYGRAPTGLPRCLRIVARTSRPSADPRHIQLHNDGGGSLPQADEPAAVYHRGDDWLDVRHTGKNNAQRLEVRVDARRLPPGMYTATVHVTVPGAVNATQGFLVELLVPISPPMHYSMRNVDQVVVNTTDRRFGRFSCTPYFWVRPEFQRLEQRGYGGEYYMTNGGRAVHGEFARFTPDLREGAYEISFAEETPFEPERRAMSHKGPFPVNPTLNPGSRFMVRIHSRGEDEQVWVEPAKTRTIGAFEFDEGMDGFVDVLAEGSSGQVLLDALVFRRVDG